MWSLGVQDIFALRSPGGDAFTAFIDSVIRAQAYVCGLPDAAIKTNQKTTAPDGGVDTQVDPPCPNDVTGWMSVPTCWQYKTEEARRINDKKLRDDIQKRHAIELIKSGYAYRFCVADELTAEKKTKWIKILTAESTKIKATAPPALVLTASDLGAWANRFPAVVIRLKGPKGEIQHFKAWGQSITTQVPKFVETAQWSTVRDQILGHVDLSRNVRDPLVAVQGAAGTGKTRFVYEALGQSLGAANLVAYTINDVASEITAAHLANDDSLRAILIADECSLATRVKLQRILAGHCKRVRVVAIDNTGERPPSGAAELWLDKISQTDLDSVLNENFPGIPPDRRRAYARLAEGFVRLAADLCRDDPGDATPGRSGRSLGNLRDYFVRRLDEPQRTVVEALALFQKIGYRDDVKDELEQLRQFLGLTMHSNQILEIANRIKDVPGFVNYAGRYLYITPEIIAEIAFARAWDRWAVPLPPQTFFSKLPQSLLEPFMVRVSRSAPPEVRQLATDFFRSWMTDLTPASLTDVSAVDRLAILAENDPKANFPLLRRLVEDSTLDQLRLVTGDGIGRWGPRRTLVWLAENMASFQEHFEDAEAILLRLALAESEPKIGNNATEIWYQLFRIILSGTATPFLERLGLLRKRIFSDDNTIAALGLKALTDVYETSMTKIVGPSVVGRRIPPTQWTPKTDMEMRQCYAAAIDLLVDLCKQASLAEAAYEIAIRHTRTFLNQGYLKQLMQIFPPKQVPPKYLPQLIEALQTYRHYDDARQIEGKRADASYSGAVKKWLEDLPRGDFHDRLLSVVGREVWHNTFYGDEDRLKTELQAIANEFVTQPDQLKAEMEWLSSEAAKSGVPLGEEIAKKDPNGRLFHLILGKATEATFPGLARGYILGALASNPDLIVRINKWLDEIEREHPKTAFHLFIYGDSSLRPLERTLALIDKKLLPPEFLGSFLSHAAQGRLSMSDLCAALKRLVIPTKNGDKAAAKVAVDLIAYQLKGQKKDKENQTISLPSGCDTNIWDILEFVAQQEMGETFGWSQVLRDLIPNYPKQVIHICCLAFTGEGFSYHREAEKILILCAKQSPSETMKQIGKVMLDRKRGWRMTIGNYKELFTLIPIEAIKGWLKSNGVQAVRVIARHLPLPFINKEGQPVVPELTEFVLKHFGKDKETFNHFCVGAHNLQMYSGDIASQHEQEAEVAKKFLSHPLPHIRKWAAIEVDSSLKQTQHWRQEDEERRIS